MDLKKKIKNFLQDRNKLVDQIIESKLKNLEKLKLLSENRLLPINKFVVDLFEKEGQMLKEQFEEKYPNETYFGYEDYFCIKLEDNFFHRYEVINFYKFIDEYLEVEDESIVVARCSGTVDEYLEITMSAEELKNKIYEYVFTKKEIGFINDW